MIASFLKEKARSIKKLVTVTSVTVLAITLVLVQAAIISDNNKTPEKIEVVKEVVVPNQEFVDTVESLRKQVELLQGEVASLKK